MSQIKSVFARQILDSRGNPTVEAVVSLEDGARGQASVPSGASTGAGEALELRDGGEKFGGKGVETAVKNVNEEIAPILLGENAADQEYLDQKMCDLDGTENKSKLGANAILAVSLAIAKAEAASENLALYQYIAKITGTSEITLPLPMMNVMNGGAHAGWSTDIQEYMILPVGAKTFADTIRMGAEIFHNLGAILKSENYPTTVGDEGGYAPKLPGGNEKPLEFIARAIEKSGYKLGEDVALGLDVASSEFFANGNYNLKADGRKLAAHEMIELEKNLAEKFPIISIEDGLSESDWENWRELNAEIGEKIQLVGDDLLVTNTKLLQCAIDEKAANAILIKPNQIGSLSETIAAVKLAQKNNFRTIMSHRSGETEDATIAHLAVGLNTGQIKTGSLSRSDRIAKYNELLRISDTAPEIQLARPFDK